MYSKDNISNASDEKLCELVIAGSQEAEEDLPMEKKTSVDLKGKL